MSDIPTPRTERITENIEIAIRADNREQSIAHKEEAIREIEQLERELAEAREAYSQSYTAECARSDGYKQQRDRLARLLKWADEELEREGYPATDPQFLRHQIGEALAAVEGDTQPARAGSAEKEL